MSDHRQSVRTVVQVLQSLVDEFRGQGATQISVDQLQAAIDKVKVK